MTAANATGVLLACDWLLKYTAGLAGGLARAGAAPVLLTRDHGMEFGGPEALRDGIAALAGPEVPTWMLSGRVRSLRAVGSLRAAASARRRLAPDVVHVQGGVENDARLLLAAGIPRQRYAYTVHDPVSHLGAGPPSLPYRLFHATLLRRASLVFVHGEALRDELLEHRQVTGPIEVIPHGTAPPVVTPLPSRPSLLFFGRIVEYKGLDVLLDAMEAIWARQGDCRLVVAGEGELPRHPLLADERVVVRNDHVPEPELPRLFGEATIVVLPYVQASQSGVGSLAKTYARPIVATDAGGLPELVADGSGRLVAPGDAAALADAIASLLATPQQLQAMASASARSADGSSSWENVGRLTLAAYERHGLIRHDGERR